MVGRDYCQDVPPCRKIRKGFESRWSRLTSSGCLARANRPESELPTEHTEYTEGEAGGARLSGPAYYVRYQRPVTCRRLWQRPPGSALLTVSRLFASFAGDLLHEFGSSSGLVPAFLSVYSVCSVGNSRSAGSKSAA